MSAFTQGSLVYQSSTIVANSTTTVLTSSSTVWQRVEGAANQIIRLPDATLVKQGRQFVILNKSTGYTYIVNYSGEPVYRLSSSDEVAIRLHDVSTQNGVWDAENLVDFTKPLTLSQEYPPSSKLVINSSVVKMPDGTEARLPSDNATNTFPRTTIDFVAGLVNGGTVLVNGHPFALPVVTTGQFVRCALSYDQNSNKVNMVFSDPAASISALSSPAALSNKLHGRLLGCLDLESINPSKFRSAGSLISQIENEVGGETRIFNFDKSETQKNENLVRNSDFENGTDFWSTVGSVALGVESGSAALTGRSLKITTGLTLGPVNTVVGQLKPLSNLSKETIQYISFSYRNGTSYSDFKVTIYDLDTLTEIEPESTNIGLGVGQYKYAWVPAHTTSTNYEIRIQCLTPNATLILDDAYVGSDVRISGYLPGVNDPSQVSTQRSDLVWNSDVALSSNSTAFEIGPSGVALLNNTSGSPIFKRVRFPSTVINYSFIQLEVSVGGIWSPAEAFFPHTGANMGLWFTAAGPNEVDVWIGSTPNATQTWAQVFSELGVMNWRVRLPGFLGVGVLVPASKSNTGYMTNVFQELAGPKKWYSADGTTLLIEWRDDGTVNIPGTLLWGNARGAVPVGSVIPLFSNIAGSYPAPAPGTVSPEGWMLCDGSLIPPGYTLSGNTPNLTNSTFILGSDGSGSTGADSNPPIGLAGGANTLSTPPVSVTWGPSEINCTVTNPTWVGGGSFMRTDFNSNQIAHTHGMQNHTHQNYHSHLMRHVHKTSIWKQSITDDFKLQAQENDVFDYTTSNLASPEDLIHTVEVASGTGSKVAALVDQLSPSDLSYYTGGISGANGDGNVARTEVENTITNGPSVNITGDALATFQNQQSVGVVGSNNGTQAKFNKTELNSDQVAHAHTISDTRPQFVSALYLIRII